MGELWLGERHTERSGAKTEMAILTAVELTAFKHDLRRNAKQLMRDAQLSKTDWTAALQAIEDDFENRRANRRNLVNAAVSGPDLDPALIRKLVRAWMTYKAKGE